MRATILLAVFVPLVVLGIYYVPRHDGRPEDLLLAVLLPTAGVCWSVWQLVARPRKNGKKTN